MSGLKELSARMASISSVQKTTKVMQMISMNKLKTTQRRLRLAHSNVLNLIRMMRKFEKIGGDFVMERDNDDVMFVIFSSNRGLCGGFNSSIARFACKKVNEFINDGKSVKLLFVGSKAHVAMKGLYDDDVLSVVDYPVKGVVEVSDVVKFMMEIPYLLSFREVYLLFNRFESMLRHEQVMYRLFPFSDNGLYDHALSVEDEAVHYVDGVEFEPKLSDVIEELYRLNAIGMLYYAILSSLASEHSARAIAMDGANTNTRNMLRELKLLYNRSRQAAITKSLIEVVSGSEAL